MPKFLQCSVLFLGMSLISISSYSQDCAFFRAYPDEVKTRSASFIDSLRRIGVDTILFYGLGTPETGRMAYGKIFWATETGIYSAEVIRGQYDKKKKHFNMKPIVYNLAETREPLQFYLDNHLDTVNTNPRELHWMSHDYLHYVFGSVARTSTCFVAENHLLRDTEHLRSQWIIILNLSIDSSRETFKIYKHIPKS